MINTKLRDLLPSKGIKSDLWLHFPNRWVGDLHRINSVLVPDFSNKEVSRVLFRCLGGDPDFDVFGSILEVLDRNSYYDPDESIFILIKADGTIAVSVNQLCFVCPDTFLSFGEYLEALTQQIEYIPNEIGSLGSKYRDYRYGGIPDRYVPFVIIDRLIQEPWSALNDHMHFPRGIFDAFQSLSLGVFEVYATLTPEMSRTFQDLPDWVYPFSPLDDTEVQRVHNSVAINKSIFGPYVSRFEEDSYYPSYNDYLEKTAWACTLVLTLLNSTDSHELMTELGSLADVPKGSLERVIDLVGSLDNCLEMQRYE